MKNQLTFRIFSVLAVLSLMLSAVGMPNFSAQAETTITIDGTVPDPQTFTSTTSNAVTFTDAPTGTGLNRLMLVGVSWNSSGNARTISSVVFTYDSTDVSLTQVISQTHSTQNRYAAIWQLVNPPPGETGNVKVTFSGSISNGIVVDLINFAGVDQTTPIGTKIGTSGGTSTSSESTPSLTVGSLSGDELILDTLMIGGTAGSISDPSPATGQNIRWDDTVSNARGLASTRDANGNTSVDMEWSLVTGYWAQVAVAINPAAAGITHNLTMAANPSAGGTTIPEVGGPYSYPENQVVDIEAHANVGYVFTSWSGGVANPSAASTTVTMDADKTVTANFTAQNYNLTMAVDPAGAGTTSPAAGSSYPYGAGAVVDISATAAAGYAFDHWVGDVADANSAATTVTMDGNKSVTALFSSLYVDGAYSSFADDDVELIDISHTTGTGQNRLMLVGISWNCGNTDRTIDSVIFSYGSAPQIDLPLTLVKTQKTGADEDKTRYSAIYSLLNPPSGQSGTVSIDFSGSVSNGIVAGAINFAGVDQTTPLDDPNGANGNNYNAIVSLTGLSGDELVFDNVFQGATDSDQTLTAGSGQSRQWHEFEGNTLGTASIRQASGSSVEMSWVATESSYWAIVAVAINPAVEVPTYDLTMAVSPPGSGTTTPAVGVHPYAEDTVVNISADAESGYVFDHWTGDVENSTAADTTVTMDANKAVTAYFEKITVTGNATSSATPSDATPDIGDQITVDINIDVSNVDEPNHQLGSFTASLDWDPAILSYVSNSGLKAGFTGAVNITEVSTGHMAFNGANASGATGDVEVFTITFDVVGGGTSDLDLEYSAMAAAVTFADLLPILSVNDGQVEVATSVISLDGAVSSTTADGVSSVSFSHTTGTGVNRLLMVGVSSNSYNGAQTISSVTFTPSGGSAIALSEVGSVENEAGRLSAIYGLVNPPSGAAGTVTITYSGSVGYGIVAGAVNFDGVNQSDPFDTYVSAVGTQTSSINLVVPTEPNDLVFDNIFLGAATLPTLAVGGNQAQLWNTSIDRARGAASYETATSTSTAISWSPSGGATEYYWAIGAVPINPAPAGTVYELTVAVDPTGGGTTTPSVGVHSYLENDVVNVTATPADGYEFDHWSGACTGSGACSVTMDSNKSVTAHFAINPEEITFTGEELLGRPTDTSISVKVVPDVAITLYYEYGTTSGVYTGQTSPVAAPAGEPNTVVINGLSPNTRYYYRMQFSHDGGTTWTARQEHSFHTQRAEGSTFSFTITTDSHVNILLGDADTWTATLNDVAADNPDFHFDLGDTFAMRSVSAGNVSGAENAYKYQLPFFNIISHSAPIFLTPGNHEQQEGWHLIAPLSTSLPVIGTNAQKKYFLNPVPDSFYSGDENTYSYLSGDQFREDYYAWEWGDALFVVICPYWYTTTKPYVSDPGGGETDTTGSGDTWDWTLGQEQFNWLKQTLSESTAPYKFVLTHQLVSDGSISGQEDYGHGGANTSHIGEWGGYNENNTYGWDTERPGWGDETVHDMLVNYNVSAIFHAHDHQYAYEIKDGVVYQAVPSAGFDGDGFDIYTTGDGYTIKALDNPGHLKVTVSPAQTTVDYIQTSETTIEYSYTIAPSTYNQPPVVSDIPDQTISEGATFTQINLDNYVSDPDDDDSEMDWEFSGNSDLSVSIVNRVATIGMPDADWNGAETISFKATDPGDLYDEDEATFRVTGGNDAPVVSDIPDQTINEGETFATINLDDYVLDVDDDDAQMTWTSSGNVDLSVSIVNRVATIGIPDVDWNGAETITFKATDPGGLFDENAATFTVIAVNDAPIANAQSVTTDEDTAKAITLTGSDAEGDGLTYEVVDTPTHGTLSGTAPDLLYTPDDNFLGDDSFTFKVNDGTLDSPKATVSITVNPVNDAPAAVDDAFTTAEDTALVLSQADLTGNDTDVDNLNTELSVITVTNPVKGMVEFNAGVITFTPDQDFVGTAEFDYTVSDGVLTDEGHVTIEVSAVNDAPVITEGDSVLVHMSQNGNPIPFKLTLHATDTEDDELAWSINTEANHGTATVGGNGMIGYTPVEDFTGDDTFVVQVSDGNGGVDTIIVNVRITPFGPVITIFLPVMIY